MKSTFHIISCFFLLILGNNSFAQKKADIHQILSVADEKIQPYLALWAENQVDPMLLSAERKAKAKHQLELLKIKQSSINDFLLNQLIKDTKAAPAEIFDFIREKYQWEYPSLAYEFYEELKKALIEKGLY